MNNTYNKIYSGKNNSLIHYINHKSSFDLLIEKILGEHIIRLDDISESNYFTMKNIIFNNYELFIHNNSIINLCSQNGIILYLLKKDLSH